ncbi:hypothetical protein LOTGIDRAFT_165438 [Lottia gigantea]|uniref:Uncharacterized protein n=1 Tax=Lottia gigantea TaxID=225164 RepID=V4BIY4_LOTGI|nr:hypothetical protein LOTGIDRAFT_165438 [Lottia gigantea]ESO88654.1 hypothetical protein LOTGIDRAFT_165438 [Lottia gigantea]
MGDKHLQDIYLHACINRQAPKRKRPRTGEKTDKKGGKQYTYTYNIKLSPTEMIHVCATAFTALHGIGTSRFKRIRSVTDLLPPTEGRGGHHEHPVLIADIRQQIKDQIASFPRRESHYSRKNNRNRQYLNESLTVKRMWLLYLEKYEPEQGLLYHNDRKSMDPQKAVRKGQTISQEELESD